MSLNRKIHKEEVAEIRRLRAPQERAKWPFHPSDWKQDVPPFTAMIRREKAILEERIAEGRPFSALEKRYWDQRQLRVMDAHHDGILVELAMKAAQNGDWDYVAEHVELGLVILDEMRDFIGQVLRGELVRPNNRAPTHEVYKTRVDLAAYALGLERTRPELKMGTIYEMTTTAANKEGINLTYDTVAKYAREYRELAMLRDGRMQDAMRFLPEIVARVTPPPKRFTVTDAALSEHFFP
jgi:hypothetical protein